MPFECKNAKNLLHTHTHIFFVSYPKLLHLIWLYGERGRDRDEEKMILRHAQYDGTVSQCVRVWEWDYEHAIIGFLYSPISFTLITRTPRYLSLSLISLLCVSNNRGVFFSSSPYMLRHNISVCLLSRSQSLASIDIFFAFL